MFDFNHIDISMNDLKVIDELQKANKPYLEGSTLDHVFRTDLYKEVREIYIRTSPEAKYTRLVRQGFSENSQELNAVIDLAYYINNDKKLGIGLYCTLKATEKEVSTLSDFIEQNINNKRFEVFTIREYLKEPFKLKKLAPRHYSYEVVKGKEFADHWEVFIVDPYKKKDVKTRKP